MQRRRARRAAHQQEVGGVLEMVVDLVWSALVLGLWLAAVGVRVLRPAWAPRGAGRPRAGRAPAPAAVSAAVPAAGPVPQPAPVVGVAASGSCSATMS